MSREPVASAIRNIYFVLGRLCALSQRDTTDCFVAARSKVSASL